MSLAALFLAAVAVAAALPPTPTVVPPPSRTVMDQSEVRICRVEPVTGTRLGASRACHTEAEWAELRRQAIQNVNRIQNNRPWNAVDCPTSLKPGC